MEIQPLKRLVLTLLLAGGIGAGNSSGQSNNDIAIIAHKDVPVDELSFAEVRKVFRGERQFWNSGLRVTLLVRAPVAHERDVVLKKIYEMSEAQYRQFWIAKVFRADTTAGPKTVYSNDMTSELVTGIPGAIAFVELSRVPPGAKILKIDGVKPGEKGYPLR
jgi:ABC-type phosphate transport system substrate-binding protein